MKYKALKKRAKEAGLPSCARRLVDAKTREERIAERQAKKKKLRVDNDKKIKEQKRVLLQLGVKTRQMLKPASQMVSEQQKLAIAMLVDFEKNYPMEYIAAKVGVRVRRLQAWKNDPFFLKEMDREITRRRNKMRLKAYQNVFKRVDRGDIRTTFKYLQMTGDLSENLNITENTETEREDSDIQNEIQQLYAELGIEPNDIN